MQLQPQKFFYMYLQMGGVGVAEDNHHLSAATSFTKCDKPVKVKALCGILLVSST